MSEIPQDANEPASAPAQVQPAPAEQPAEVHAPAAQKPVRVAWVAGKETIDRFGNTLQPMAVGLMDELVELVVLCPAGCETRGLPCPPLEVIQYPRLNWPRLHPRRLEALAAEVSSRKIELVHALDVSAAALARRLAELAGVSYLLTAYSLGDGRRLGRLDSRGAGVLAASTAIQKDLLEHHVATAQKVHLLRPGVYQARHANCFSELGRRAAVIAGGDLGSFSAFDAVLECFARPHVRKYDCVFFIIGSGKAERRLRARSEKLGLRSDLTFVDRPPASRMPELLKGADIYISPSPSRSLNMEALLAMAAGVPVLAARSDAADFLQEGKTAMLFQAGNPADLTGKLTSLLDDRASARSLAESALSYLRENHSPARMVVWLASIYRQAAEMRPPQ